MEKAAVKKIRVGILDDHQTSIDSYEYRLSERPNIEVVATASYGNDLRPMLEKHLPDVLVLDVNVPNSEEDRNPYPILTLVPALRSEFPKMHILIISMHEQQALVKFLLGAGASGYILKEDREAIRQLAEAVTLINTGGVYVSKRLRESLGASSASDTQLLSKRQREALSLAAAYPDIRTEDLGKRMNIAPSTLRNLLSKAYKRLHVRNRLAATEKARRMGLITPISDEPTTKSN